MSSKNYKHLFGPVKSSRLGRSLGIDLVPLKTCTYNCLYCQLGASAKTTQERREYVSAAKIISEVKSWLGKGGEADYLTLSGSGEPTLNCRLGEIIEGIKGLGGSIPLAVITNGSLLCRPEVRDELMDADVVLPSLDAVDEESFRAINRPLEVLEYDRILAGLRDFSLVFRGEIWLEVFLLAGVNDSDQHIEKLAALLETISVDKLQLNTVSRPVGEKVERVSHRRLEEIRKRLGDKAEVIVGGEKERPYGAVGSSEL